MKAIAVGTRSVLSGMLIAVTVLGVACTDISAPAKRFPPSDLQRVEGKVRKVVIDNYSCTSIEGVTTCIWTSTETWPDEPPMASSPDPLGGGGSGSAGGVNAPQHLTFPLWSMWAHNAILDHAFPDLKLSCPGAVQRFKTISLEEDLKHTDDYRRHYLRDAGTPPQAARNASVAWINERLQAAKVYAGNGQWGYAHTELAMAMHTITDMNSPVHRDPVTGLPNIWPVPDGVDDNHSFTDWDGRERTRDITDALFTTMTTALNGAYNKVVEYAALKGRFPECPY